MSSKAFPIILEYCGGEYTNKLHLKLSKDNPDHKINVLDNASPQNRCNVITHQNKINSFAGGGIRDCIKLARQSRSKYLFFFANDVVLKNKIDIKYFENLMEKNRYIVQAGASLTTDSDKTYYPWMINKGNKDRTVRHSDFLACIFRLDFFEKFEFPKMISGWGYDWEFSYHAKLNNKKIVISDKFLIKHDTTTDKMNIARKGFSKLYEARSTYEKKYGSHFKIMPQHGEIYLT